MFILNDILFRVKVPFKFYLPAVLRLVDHSLNLL